MNTMRRLLLSLVLWAVGGAAWPQAAQFLSTGAGDLQVPVTSIRQARWAGTLLQQYDFSCGSAAVATLLTHHYGYPISEQAVFEEMYAGGDQPRIQKEGFSLLDMKRGWRHTALMPMVLSNRWTSSTRRMFRRLC